MKLKQKAIIIQAKRVEIVQESQKIPTTVTNQGEGKDKRKKDITITTIITTTNNKNGIAWKKQVQRKSYHKNFYYSQSKNQPISLGHGPKEEAITTTKTNKKLN